MTFRPQRPQAVHLPGDDRTHAEQLARNLCTLFNASQEEGCAHCDYGDCVEWERYLSVVGAVFVGMVNTVPQNMVAAAVRDLKSAGAVIVPGLKTLDIELISRRVISAAAQIMDEQHALRSAYVDRQLAEENIGTK